MSEGLTTVGLKVDDWVVTKVPKAPANAKKPWEASTDVDEVIVLIAQELGGDVVLVVDGSGRSFIRHRSDLNPAPVERVPSQKPTRDTRPANELPAWALSVVCP